MRRGEATSTERRGGPVRVAPDLWLLAASLAAGLGAARLTRAPGAAHVVAPVVACVVAGHVATSIARRMRWGLHGSVPSALLLGLAGVALAMVWGPLLSATRSGLPTPTTWHLLISRFEAAGTTIRSNPTPVPATAGVVQCVAVGAGLVAVMGRAVWGTLEERAVRPLAAPAALAPSFGLFCYAALLSSDVDRVAGAVAYLAAALGFVLVADHGASGAAGRAAGWRQRFGAPTAAPGPVGTGAAPPGASGRAVLSGLLAMVPAALGVAAAVVVPLAVSPSLASLHVDAVPFANTSGTTGSGGSGGSGAAGGGGSAFGPGGLGFGNGGTGSGSASIGVGPGTGLSGVRTIDLVDNLQSVLTDRSGEVMFSAVTPHATYWQVAVLSDFDGSAWLPDPTTQSAAEAIAQPAERSVSYLPVLPEPRATRSYRATVTIDDLESTLLPLPPTTVSVDTDADVVPGFGAVQPVESPAGEQYTAVAAVPVTPSGNRSVDDGVPASSLAPYLQLPGGSAIAPAVVRLAHEIVAGAQGPAAEAAALARYFDSGRFRYTLTPPPSTGSDPLSNFLFVTKAGFCQQFAAAYAAMARIDGLPTRVAVGFTTGEAVGHDRYRITGADAHVWPEVYLGPATGWTSYEPTPASAGDRAGIGVNSGSRVSGQGRASTQPSSTSSTVTPIRHAVSPHVSVPGTFPPVPGAHHATRAPRPARTSDRPVAVVAGIAAAVAVVGAALVAGVRIRRRRARVGGGGAPGRLGLVDRWRLRRLRAAVSADPTTEVMARWHEADWVLGRVHLGRQAAETLPEHAARLHALVDTRWLAPYTPTAAAVDAYQRLSALAARAAYSPDPCTADDAADAGRLGDLVRAAMASGRREAAGGGDDGEVGHDTGRVRGWRR